MKIKTNMPPKPMFQFFYLNQSFPPKLNTVYLEKFYL